jgi:hypothetical protein
MVKAGVIVFATQDCKDGRADARRWLKETGLKPDQVRLFVADGQVLVETLKPVWIGRKPG